MQLTTDQNGILQTEISKKYNVVSVRSNGAIIDHSYCKITIFGMPRFFTQVGTLHQMQVFMPHLLTLSK